MIVYKNIGLDNIRKKKNKEKRRVKKYFYTIVNLLESLIYLKACLKIVIFSWYVRSLPFVSRFTSILMLEGSQLRLLYMISLLSVYLSQSKMKWWEFSHGSPQLQEAFDKIFTLHKS